MLYLHEEERSTTKEGRLPGRTKSFKQERKMGLGILMVLVLVLIVILSSIGRSR